jgi:ankyrin repeat protein
MKKTAPFWVLRKCLFFFSAISCLAATARPQDVFDLYRQGDIPAVKALIEKSPQLVNGKGADGMALLHYAAYGKDVAIVNFLIDKGAKPDLANAEAKTPLHLAAMLDRREIVAALLKRGALLNAKDDYQRTALHLCARERGEAATARLLIEACADLNGVDKFGDTALTLAAWRGKAEFVDLLLERGAEVPPPGDKRRELLSMAASKGLPALFRRLTSDGGELKALTVADKSILHAAAAGGSAEIVASLLDQGLNPGLRDSSGWTPLHYAARDGRTEAAGKLIERGAPVNDRTLMGQTAYNIARERKMAGVAAFLVEKGADQSDIHFPVLTGDYLGQKPPAGKAEVFGLGIISSIWSLHTTAVFSPDGSEVAWAPQVSYPGEMYSRGSLLMMKRVDGRWTPPAPAPFSLPDTRDDVPFYSADGKRICFISNRPLPGVPLDRKERIWFADRTSSGWSEPAPLDPAVNDHPMHWSFSLAANGDLYFGGQAADSRGMNDIYRARFVDGKYEKPVNLGDPINTAEDDQTPFIAPDGSYILFSRQYDIWVSFRAADGKWADPIKFGPEVNSPEIELCPFVTADGKILFFMSNRNGKNQAYWLSADFIERARPKR